MAKTYKSDFEVFNGTDYDKHCFSTTADQVKRENGTSVEIALAELPSVYFLQSNIVAITWDNIPNGSSGILRSYDLPDGFTGDNCVIISASFCQPSVNTNWQYSSKIQPSIGSGIDRRVMIVLDTTGDLSVPYTAKVVLMKVS